MMSGLGEGLYYFPNQISLNQSHHYLFCLLDLNKKNLIMILKFLGLKYVEMKTFYSSPLENSRSLNPCTKAFMGIL